MELLERTDAAKRPVRLLGVGVHGLCGVDEAPRQQTYLGDEAFVERMQALAEPLRIAAREIPNAQRRTIRSLAQWLSACDSREQALFRAHTESRLTMSARAKALVFRTWRAASRPAFPE